MWAQLGLAALQGLSQEQARKQNLESNVIKEKYSHWTGNNGDFSQQGQNKMASTLAGGLAAGMAQDQWDKLAEKSDLAAAKATNDADADFYGKLSKDPSSVGVTPVGPAGGSSFSAIARPAASRAPATVMGPPAPAPAPAMGPEGFQQVLQSSSPWEMMSKQQLPQRQPLMSDFHQPAQSYSPPGSAWFGSTPLGGGR
jgi:hypothetical protein